MSGRQAPWPYILPKESPHNTQLNNTSVFWQSLNNCDTYIPNTTTCEISLTYTFFTNSMEHSPYWKSFQHGLLVKSPTFLEPKGAVPFSQQPTAHNQPLIWARWIQSTASNPTSIRFILILSPKWSPPFRLTTKVLHTFSHFSCVCHMPCPPHPPWFKL
jgi:hypothetical protein